MKKVVSIFALVLLVILTGSKTLAYWHNVEILSPPFFTVPTTIKIGSWNYSTVPDYATEITDITEKRNYYQGQIVLYEDRYFYIFRDQNETYAVNRDNPWTIPYKVYGPIHKYGFYYKTGSFVIKDDHIFRAHNEGSSHHVPEVDKNRYIWTDLGSIESKSFPWKKGFIPKKGDPVYYDGKIYLVNEEFKIEDNIQPGNGRGYNLYNELDFDEYTIYEKYDWMPETGLHSPIVVYNNKLYTLNSNTNRVGDKLVKPGENDSVWKAWVDPHETP